MSTPQPSFPRVTSRTAPRIPIPQAEEWIDGAQDKDADAPGPISADNQPDGQRENTDHLTGKIVG